MRAFALVASCLVGLNPDDSKAVTEFYEVTLPTYPEPAQDFVADYLISCTRLPEADELKMVKDCVDSHMTT